MLWTGTTSPFPIFTCYPHIRTSCCAYKLDVFNRCHSTVQLPQHKAVLGPLIVLKSQVTVGNLLHWSQSFEKLLVPQLVKKFPVFVSTWRFSAFSKAACHLSSSWASQIQSTSSHPIALRSMLMLFTHLCLGLQSGLFPLHFPAKPYMHFSSSTHMPLDLSISSSFLWSSFLWKHKIMKFPAMQLSPVSCAADEVRTCRRLQSSRWRLVCWTQAPSCKCPQHQTQAESLLLSHCWFHFLEVPFLACPVGSSPTCVPAPLRSSHLQG
jgi:hypothetical protein